MKLSLILAIVPFLAHNCVAQEQPNASSIFLRRYVADVRLMVQGKLQSGILFALTDSTLLLAALRDLQPQLMTLMNQHGGTLPPTDSLQSALPLRAYRYADISRLVVHRRGHRGIGFVIGAGLGLALGLSAGDDGYTSPTSKALLAGFFLAFPGLLISSALSNKSTNAKKQPMVVAARERFQKYTIVDQLKQANLYTP